MDNKMSDAYYLKAHDNYPYEMSVVVENLGYALGCDEDHPGANTLMGQVMLDMSRLEEAEYYLERAIQSDLGYVDAFYRLCDLKITVGKYEDAHRIIDYAIKIDGANKFLLYRYRARTFESQGEFDLSIASLEQAIEHTYSDEDLTIVRDEVKRIKRKRKIVTWKGKQSYALV